MKNLVHILIVLATLSLVAACGGQEATATPEPPVEESTPDSLSLGDSQVRPADGMVMVYVPGGTFQMGSTDDEIDVTLAECEQDLGFTCDRSWYADESPQHPVTLDDFWIDQTEVTNAQYRLCVEAGQCEAPTTCDFGEPTYEDASKADHPVVCVDWYGAEDYCEWVDARLPTEAEWEYAARGEQGYIYPWGDEFDCSRCNFDDQTELDDGVVPGGKGCDGFVSAAPVGSYPIGASWCGALDMAGNAWEWVADWYGDYPSGTQTNPTGPATGDYKAMRGGSYFTIRASVRAATRSVIPHQPPTNRASLLGFRCAAPSGR